MYQKVYYSILKAEFCHNTVQCKSILVIDTSFIYNTLQVYAINGTITPSCNENLDAELRKMWVCVYLVKEIVYNTITVGFGIMRL